MINWRSILHVLSSIVLIVAFCMLLPAGVAFAYQEYAEAIDFLYVLGASVLIFGPIFLLSRTKEQMELSNRDGFMLVTLSWIAASAVGAAPFVLSGAIPSYTDAYFETMSGFTTTGASILSAIESIPYSMLFWRSLTHWLGGMGIVVLAVAILPLIGIGGFPLIQAESPGPRVDKIVPKVQETAKILWLIYVGLSVIETALLMYGGMNWFDAVTHTFGTMATGGFSPKNTSVGFYTSPFVHNVITIFMVLAGVNFGLYFVLLQGNLKSIRQNTELKVYIAIFAITTLLIAGNLYISNTYNDFGESVQYAGFQTASILTTTGYATADFDQWPFFARSLLFLLMFVGGCSGSTGGGIKVIRITALAKLAYNELKHILNPRRVQLIRMNKEPVKKDMIYTITGFVLLYLLSLLITTLAVAFSGIDVWSSFTTALATVGNIGPGFGLVGPSMNYSFMEPWLKWVLSFSMMIGRLEIYTVLVILTPGFWKK